MQSLIKKIFFVLILCMTALSESYAAAPVISADAAVVMNANTGEVLYSKNPTRREYPASLTKMMTCILSIEKGDPYKVIAITPGEANVESTALNAGNWIRLSDLRQQMMMISDNGAATAIADTIGGSVPKFAAMMNEKAKEIGCTGTHFVNANGMPNRRHYSTALDMAKIAQYGMKNREFRRIVATRNKQIHYLRPATNFRCENTNELLYTYTGCNGIKTGWTRAAGGCLAASAERGGTELIVVVMHSNNEDSRFSEAARLLDYGFSIVNDKKQSLKKAA